MRQLAEAMGYSGSIVSGVAYGPASRLLLFLPRPLLARGRGFTIGAPLFWLLAGALAGCASTGDKQSSAAAASPDLLEQLQTEVTPEDRRKERIIKNEIIALGDRTPLRIQVKVFNDQALLVGETLNQATREKLEVAAVRKARVRRVFNQIDTANPLPSYKGFTDIILKVRVGLALKSVKEIDVSKVEHLVDRERIYLMGLVTENEADILVNRLRQVKGVKEVVVALNYIDA